MIMIKEEKVKLIKQKEDDKFIYYNIDFLDEGKYNSDIKIEKSNHVLTGYYEFLGEYYLKTTFYNSISGKKELYKGKYRLESAFSVLFEDENFEIEFIK
jgi:hypothetical protein